MKFIEVLCLYFTTQLTNGCTIEIISCLCCVYLEPSTVALPVCAVSFPMRYILCKSLDLAGFFNGFINERDDSGLVVRLTCVSRDGLRVYIIYLLG